MARKNRNARSRSYCSFEELKGTTVKFNLENGQFIKKGFVGIKNAYAELNLNIVNGGSNQGICLSFSIREDVGQKMIDKGGRLWTCGIVKAGNLERLYIITDPRGYTLCDNKTSPRFYMKLPIDAPEMYDKYIGSHEIKYDEENEAYYIEPVKKGAIYG